ncbi:MAG: hypothetical protein KDD45_03150 [Bdellovibrionales bacterium]|nr:hypothetical protein [Bdellovibrionales bacterium]
MGMLDRYKKKGGFIQLLNLLETSSKTKQEQFLNLIQQESPQWAEELKKRILTIDKVLTWEKEALSEIITRVQPLTLAVALRFFSEPQKEIIMGVLSQSDQRKIQNMLTETNPNQAEILTCVSKIVAEVRTLIQQGIVKLEKVDPDMAIPENIEDLIAQKAQPNYIEFESTPSSGSSSSLASDSEPETTLDFSGANRNRTPSSEKSESSKEELEFLKRKVNTLVQENSHLKQELSVLRTKLDQIKKIA